MKKKNQSAWQAWKILLLSLPKGIAAFVTVVAGLSVSLPLSVFLIGLPLLAETFVLCTRMMEAERVVVGRWLQGDPQNGTPEARAKWNGWRAHLAVIGKGRSYRGILYGLLQLPIGIACFTLAVVVPITSWAIMLSPLAYQISTRMFSFELFSGDVLMDRLLPTWSSFERSWLYGGIGVVLVLLTPVIIKACGRMYAAWVLGVAGPLEETRHDSTNHTDNALYEAEKLPEPRLYA